MKRHWVYALATLVALPGAARAQSFPGWGPVLRVTPFVGVSPGFSQEGIADVLSNNVFSRHPYELDYGSSVSFGANVEARVWNRFALVAGGVWSSRGEGELIDFEDEVVFAYEGATLWMAKAGLAMRLREVRPDLQLRRLNASIFVAPAFIHDDPKTSLATPPGSDDAVNHWGLNLGIDAELPLTNRQLAFQLGFEDWMIFWDEETFASRIAGYIRTRPGRSDAAVSIDPDNTHVVLFRAGLSWRF